VQERKVKEESGGIIWAAGSLPTISLFCLIAQRQPTSLHCSEFLALPEGSGQIQESQGHARWTCIAALADTSETMKISSVALRLCACAVCRLWHCWRCWGSRTTWIRAASTHRCSQVQLQVSSPRVQLATACLMFTLSRGAIRLTIA
jgi:hypothetical protein